MGRGPASGKGTLQNVRAGLNDDKGGIATLRPLVIYSQERMLPSTKPTRSSRAVIEPRAWDMSMVYFTRRGRARAINSKIDGRTGVEVQPAGTCGAL